MPLAFDDEDGARRRDETSWTPVLDDCQRAGPIAWQLRPDQHGERDFRRVRQTRQSLDRHRRTQSAQFGNLGDVEVLTVLELPVQLAARQGEAARFGGFDLELRGELVDGLHQRTLVGGEPEIHQRGSRGSLSRSVAMRLSWISAAPEAMPATTAR